MRTSLATPLPIQDTGSFRNTLVGKGTIIVAATGFVAICAHISVPLPFTMVPLTLQTFAVILVGMLLGPTAAAAAMTLYLAEGAMGLPVFSPHGPGGLAQLLGPVGGYLLSYPFAAALAGAVVRMLRNRSSQMTAGHYRRHGREPADLRHRRRLDGLSVAPERRIGMVHGDRPLPAR